MPRGSKPGEYRGGIKKGARHKKTIEREIREQIASGSPNAPAGIAKDVLAEFMMLFRGYAAQAQQRMANADDTSGMDPVQLQAHRENKKAHVEDFKDWAKLAVHTAHWLAPYQSPTFKAIIMDGKPPELDLVEVVSLSIFDDHKKLIEHRPADKARVRKAVMAAEAIDDDED